MCMSLKLKCYNYTVCLVAVLSVLLIFPKIIPFSVEDTLMDALMLAKSCGPRVMGDGFSTSLRSPEENT